MTIERRHALEEHVRTGVRAMLYLIGEDPDREGLQDTPRRVLKAWYEQTAGHRQDVSVLFKTFEDGACDQMVLVPNIHFASLCLAGSTFVDTPRGRVPIKYLKDGEFVYTWDEDQTKMTLARCVNPRITGKDQQLWRVFTDKDTILCTGRHKFLTYTRGWVKAKNLTPGDSVVALNRGSTVGPGAPCRSTIVWTGKREGAPEHRFVYEEINGPVDSMTHIHHINKLPNDNRPENLTALPRSDHYRLHRLEDGPTGFALFTDEQRRAMKAKQVQRIKESQTEEVRKKRSESVRKYWASLTPEQRMERNHRVLLVEKTDWKEDVWCMDVPGYENFVANGMVVHNCEHHLMPFTGVAHVAYVPNGRIVGLSKLARLVKALARRPQVQERLTQQVTAALTEHLAPKGAACMIRATHTCMSVRGVEEPSGYMVTNSLTGCFLDEPECRAEFMSLVPR